MKIVIIRLAYVFVGLVLMMGSLGLVKHLHDSGRIKAAMTQCVDVAAVLDGRENSTFTEYQLAKECGSEQIMYTLVLFIVCFFVIGVVSLRFACLSEDRLVKLTFSNPH